MYQSTEHLKRQHMEMVAQAQRRGQVARLRALRRATRRAQRAAERLDRARRETRQLRSQLNIMS
jgi:hypothetical protein